jgi:hypothetical protein
MKPGCVIALALMIRATLSLGATTMPSGAAAIGEQVPSEDPVLRDFHSLGLVEGHVDIFRCASPVRDLVKSPATRPSDNQLDAARQRMQRLYDLGIRTIICLEDPSRPEMENGIPDSSKTALMKHHIALERAAASQFNIRWVLMPMANSGPDSLQDMSDTQVLDWLDRVSGEVLRDAQMGGVMFHCASGHDRTGIVAAFIRVRYEGWPVEQAIAEMRRLGHNWTKFSNNGGISSWHEDHLRAIARMLADPPTTRP